jgi:hypothetical protein
MFGNLVGAVSTLLITGLLMKNYPGKEGILICFTMYGIVYFLGVGIWLLIDASKPIVADSEIDHTGHENRPNDAIGPVSVPGEISG